MAFVAIRLTLSVLICLIVVLLRDWVNSAQMRPGCAICSILEHIAQLSAEVCTLHLSDGSTSACANGFTNAPRLH